MELISENGRRSTVCREVTPRQIRSATSPLAERILRYVQDQNGAHASRVAKSLKQPEQKIHYHVKNLRKAGLLTVERLEETEGATAKLLKLTSQAFSISFGKSQPRTQVKDLKNAFFEPFITDGRLNAKIIIGSPDPHGPESARSRDVNNAIDFGIFLGSFLRVKAQPSVVLDTELKDWKQNMIIIGGPVVNKATDRVNKDCPVWYDTLGKQFIVKKTGQTYNHVNVGIIAKFPNPFAKEKWILLLAGKHYTGTQGAIQSLIKMLDTLTEDYASGQIVKIIEAVDMDSDGVVDSARVLT